MPAKTLNLIGRSGQQLKETLESIGVGKEQLDFRAAQLWKGIYRHGVKDFDSMPNLGRGLQEQLAEHCTLARGEIISEQTSADGTRKWLIRFAATEEQDTSVEVETVYIPETNRGTLCVSSQVGCSLSCPFCHTGTQKMVRNLTAAEILMQIMVARDQLDDFRHQSSTGSSCLPHSGRRITNIVMMGMGEPLFNFENVKQALLIALDQAGLSFSRRRVTLSTAGVVPGIARTGHEIRVALAISLHAVNDGLRDRLVPINRKYPLAQLVDACRRYPGLSNSRRITFEYVMLKGINDSIADARELIRLLADIPAKINLIPFNPWPGTDFECSEQPVIERFASRLQKNGFLTPIRIPRGDDILAACGQLKSVSKGMENVISL